MYRLNKGGMTVTRLSDMANIPLIDGNADYAEYQGWLAAGNEPEPHVEPPPGVPAVVSRFQARAALLQAGLLDDAEALMSTAAPLAKLAWTEAIEFRRDSPTLLEMTAQLGLTPTQVDELFIAAAAIQA